VVKSGVRLIASVKSETAPLKSALLSNASPRLKYAVVRSFALACLDAMIVEQADILSFKSLSLLVHWRKAGGGSAAAADTALNTQARRMKKRARNDPPSKRVARQPIPVCEDAPR
jgi:hypothetical protein